MELKNAFRNKLNLHAAIAMNESYHSFYRHSGKFGVHGPLIALAVAAILGLPLGILYGYLIKWIPFIYLNLFITIGYGCAFGFATSWLLRWAKVRNSAIALITGIAVGVIAWFLAWNGFVHAMLDDAPASISLGQLRKLMGFLYENGSWGLTRGGGAVTGIPLALVWFVEAVMIIGAAAMLSFAWISGTPFCETHLCWFDEERKIEKLDAIQSPEIRAALKAGDLSPLGSAAPRVPASGQFARLRLKHSKRCPDDCAVSIENVTVTTDKNGNPQEKTETLMTNLLVPRTTFDYLLKTENS